MAGVGKNDEPRDVYMAHNIRRFIWVKGSSQRRRALRSGKGLFIAAKGSSQRRRALRSGEGLFAAAKGSSQRRRALRSDEECLCSDLETFAIAYPKVGKGLRSGVGCYAAKDQKDRPQKIHACYAVA